MNERVQPNPKKCSTQSFTIRYSRHGDMEEMKQELKEMMNETQDVKVKEAIQKVLNEMNK